MFNNKKLLQFYKYFVTIIKIGFYIKFFKIADDYEIILRGKPCRIGNKNTRNKDRMILVDIEKYLYTTLIRKISYDIIGD